MEEVKRAKEKAHKYERDYGGCAQSVLGALQEELKIGSKDSFKAASTLAGGIARHGETCGALVGALSALGIVSGRERIEDTESNKVAMESATTMINSFKKELEKQFNFKERLSSTLCRHIQEKIYGRSFNLMDKDGFQAFRDAGGQSDTGCPKVCGIAAEIAAEKLTNNQESMF
ncbi:C-GCAxxG-C-C family protein [Chloroflexota bacterium]